MCDVGGHSNEIDAIMTVVHTDGTPTVRELCTEHADVLADLAANGYVTVGCTSEPGEYFATVKGQNYYVATRTTDNRVRLVTTLGAYGREADARYAANECNRVNRLALRH